MVVPYKFKKGRKAAPPRVSNRVETQAFDEELTGEVQGWEASDIEERFARALRKNNIKFSFREHFFGPTRTTPGAVEVDFLVESGGWWPIFIDGEYAHKSQTKRDEDSVKDARLDELLMKYGINPSRRIPDGKKYMVGDLDDQDSVDQIVEELF